MYAVMLTGIFIVCIKISTKNIKQLGIRIKKNFLRDTRPDFFGSWEHSGYSKLFASSQRKLCNSKIFDCFKFLQKHEYKCQKFVSHDFRKGLYGCVCVCVCACVCVCVCTRSILTGWGSFFSFFYSEFGKKIIFYDSPIRFCFMSNFRFSKNLLLIFFNDRTRIFESGGQHSKEHKKPIFSKKNYFSNYRGSFVITKNVFFF